MPSVKVVSAQGQGIGQKVSDRELAADVFDAEVRVPLMHQVVVAGAAAVRRGTHSTKTRGDVSGGGKKPWRQKGTGRARQGSTRAPQWTGGGVVHGPHSRDHTMRVNKKMKRGALRSALTDAVRSGKLVVVDRLAFDAPKTKQAAELLDRLELGRGKILVVVPRPSADGAIEKSFRNIRGVRVSYAGALGVYELLAADKVLMPTATLDVLEGRPEPDGAPSTPSEPERDAEEEVPADEQEVGE